MQHQVEIKTSAFRSCGRLLLTPLLALFFRQERPRYNACGLVAGSHGNRFDFDGLDRFQFVVQRLEVGLLRNEGGKPKYVFGETPAFSHHRLDELHFPSFEDQFL